MERRGTIPEGNATGMKLLKDIQKFQKIAVAKKYSNNVSQRLAVKDYWV